MGRRDWPLIGTETGDISLVQEASEKCFKRFAQIRQWGAGDLTQPFPTTFPQSDIHCLVTSDGTYTSHLPPEEAWGPHLPRATGLVPRSSHVLAHVCACLCVSCCVVKPCPSPSPN